LIVRQDVGQNRWVHGLGELEFDANNQPIRLIGTISDITERKNIEEELKNSQEQLKKFAIHIQNAREQDKILLATQLDNELSQLLVALKMDIGMLKKNVAKGIIDSISADLVAKLDQAHNLIGNSLNNTMKIMNDLRYEVLYLMGFVEAADLYISEFEKENKISCTFENTILKLDMDEKKATSLFRIFQNAMSNVAQHSKATKVKIILHKSEEKLILEIWDNGIGFDPEKSSNEASNRFIYMKERAILLNGKLQVTSLPNKGTSVRVEIPYQNK
jgi:signal transduction histidine kinase